MLDFSWIKQCSDVDTLKAIVVRLSTGEEKVTTIRVSFEKGFLFLYKFIHSTCIMTLFTGVVLGSLS